MTTVTLDAPALDRERLERAFTAWRPEREQTEAVVKDIMAALSPADARQ